jgi:alkanesulfonate monooxygenase SsuD/methylene tetrahydromethanopterin reductase-like flavin-dependent oxidoreductase (luciferase family)
MLRLTAAHADAWNTAWFGLPDDRLEQRVADFHAACADVGRDPSTVEMTIGVTVKAEADEEWGRPGAPAALIAQPEVVAHALGAYAALGAGHVQLDVQPATPDTFDRVLEGISRFRAGDAPGRAGRGG